jgi:LmbE family N-acetylglucosaminyl deacetylase
MKTVRQASLLAVFAHPDDEVFHGGVLANLGDRGARVTIACATKGEAGKPHPSVGPVEDLGARRAEELRSSCARLGIDEPLFLGFHDSGRNERLRRDDPRALVNVDMLEVEAAILSAIRDVKPQVMLTFDPHGAYYHPDHLAVHRAATAAFFSSGAMGETAPERLFYGGLLHDVFVTLAERSRGRGIVDGLDPDLFSTDPGTVAVTFDASRYLERKFSALAAHRSAFGVGDELLRNPPPGISQMLSAFRPVFEREVFVLGGTRVAAPRWPLADLFDAVETAAFDEPSAARAHRRA